MFGSRKIAVLTLFVLAMAGTGWGFLGLKARIDSQSKANWVRLSEPKARAYSSFLKGLHREGREEWSLAVRDFRETSDWDPKASSPRIHLGLALAEEGSGVESRKVLEEAYLRSGRDSRVRAAAAMAFVSRGRYREAVDELEAVLADRPSDPWALLALADIHVLSGRLEEARQTYQQLHDLRLSTGVTLFNQAVIESRLERYDEAEAHLKEALQTGAMPVSGWMALGLVFEAQDKKEEAARIYGQAAAAQPQNSRIRGNLARVLASLGRQAEAAAVYEEAFRLYPADAGPAMDGASLYIEAGMFDKAMALLDLALASGHGNAEILMIKGYGYEKSGDEAEAETYYRFAIQADDELSDAHFYLAALLDRRGEREEARHHLRRTVQIDPWNAEAYNYLGYLDVEEGRDLRHAISLIEKALEIDPENPAFLDSLGWAYFKQGLYEQSLMSLEKASDLSGQNPKIHEHLLEVYRKTGAAGAFEASAKPDGAGEEILSRGSAVSAPGSGT